MIQEHLCFHVSVAARRITVKLRTSDVWLQQTIYRTRRRCFIPIYEWFIFQACQFEGVKEHFILTGSFFAINKRKSEYSKNKPYWRVRKRKGFHLNA